MPIMHNTPISMTALNRNVDEDLIFSGAWNQIERNDDTQGIFIAGGNEHPPQSATICIYGKNGLDEGSLVFWVTNLAHNGLIKIMQVVGGTNTPTLDLNSHKIINVTDPGAAQDAATKNYIDTTLGLGTQGDLTVTAPIAISNSTRHLIGGAAAISLVNDAAATITQIDTAALSNLDTDIPTSKAVKTYTDGKFVSWVAWSPTLTWLTATPGTIVTSARYCQIGKTVFVQVQITTVDSNATTGLTIPLPVNDAAIGFSTILVAHTRAVGLTPEHAVDYFTIGSGVNALVAPTFLRTPVDGNIFNLHISGFYEVA